MAPALFNLYSCVVVQWWMARMESTDGVGVYIRHKSDGYTQNANEMKVTECQFAALLANTRAGAERSLQEYMQVLKILDSLSPTPRPNSWCLVERLQRKTVWVCVCVHGWVQLCVCVCVCVLCVCVCVCVCVCMYPEHTFQHQLQGHEKHWTKCASSSLWHNCWGWFQLSVINTHDKKCCKHSINTLMIPWCGWCSDSTQSDKHYIASTILIDSWTQSTEVWAIGSTETASSWRRNSVQWKVIVSPCLSPFAYSCGVTNEEPGTGAIGEESCVPLTLERRERRLGGQ